MDGHTWFEGAFGLAIGGELAAAVSLPLYHSKWRNPVGPAVERSGSSRGQVA